ncbi:MAG: VIT1/CCC1 transporter family protein [Chlamydiota bacterium]
MSHPSHFNEKSVVDHLIEARKKGLKASEAAHGVEPPGAVLASADAARDTSIVLALVWILLNPINLTFLQKITLLTLASMTLLIWKTCRSAFLGWSHLERIHRLIQQEKWEIDHHRDQEKKELLELYHAKGFKDKQLQEVVEVLMADDNRLLQIMLEEELGLSLGSFEHPLKQCTGAFLGVLCASVLCLGALMLNYTYGIYGAVFCIQIGSSIFTAKYLGNDATKYAIWSLGMSAVALAIPYFLYESLLHFLKLQ